MEKPIRIKLLEHEYLIRSDENEDRVKSIAQYIHDKFGEIRENTEGLSETKTAILAAFDIASEYFQLLKARDDLVENIERRAQALNSHIDSITL
ncbi:MAG: cell division protein ZapA [Desulfobulbaceae bacterium]|nr:cell division protein ZapA [Desulfobulbaceae bacterium]